MYSKYVYGCITFHQKEEEFTLHGKKHFSCYMKYIVLTVHVYYSRQGAKFSQAKGLPFLKRTVTSFLKLFMHIRVVIKQAVLVMRNFLMQKMYIMDWQFDNYEEVEQRQPVILKTTYNFTVFNKNICCCAKAVCHTSSAFHENRKIHEYILDTSVVLTLIQEQSSIRVLIFHS